MNRHAAAAACCVALLALPFAASSTTGAAASLAGRVEPLRVSGTDASGDVEISHGRDKSRVPRPQIVSLLSRTDLLDYQVMADRSGEEPHVSALFEVEDVDRRAVNDKTFKTYELVFKQVARSTSGHSARNPSASVMTHKDEPPTFALYDSQLRTISCRGADWSVDDETNTVSMAVPLSCLERAGVRDSSIVLRSVGTYYGFRGRANVWMSVDRSTPTAVVALRPA
ncbi:MAG: hypothetical protein WB471_06880 [Nocardioides sp.]